MFRGALVVSLILCQASPALAIFSADKMVDKALKDYAQRAHDLHELRSALRKTLASNGHHWLTVQNEELRRRSRQDLLHRPLQNRQENPAEDLNGMRPFRRGMKGMIGLSSRMFLRSARRIEREPLRPRIKRRVNRAVSRATGRTFDFDAAIAGSGAPSFSFRGGFANIGNHQPYTLGGGLQSGNAQPFFFGNMSGGAEPFTFGGFGR